MERLIECVREYVADANDDMKQIRKRAEEAIDSLTQWTNSDFEDRDVLGHCTIRATGPPSGGALASAKGWPTQPPSQSARESTARNCFELTAHQ